MIFLNLLTMLFATTMLAIGLYVFKRNSGQPVNRVYFIISIFAAMWTIVFRFNDLSGSIESAQLLTNMSYVIGVSLAYSLCVFTAYFPFKATDTSRIKALGLLIVPAVLAAAVGLLETVTTQENTSEYGEELSLWFIPFVLVLLGIIAVGAVNLWNAYKNSTTSKQKSQVKFVALGLTVSFVSVLVLADVIPLFAPDSRIDEFAPFGMVFFLYFSAKAIIQKRLLDLKQVSAQIISFVMTVIFVSILYLLLEYAKELLLGDFNADTTRLLFNVVFTGILIFAYGSIYHYFSNLSLRLLSENIYDTQQMLDTLNQTIVANPDLDRLLIEVSAQIQNTLDSTFCGFYIRKTSYFRSRFMSNTTSKLSLDDLEKMRELTPKIRYKIHSTEVEPFNEEEKQLDKLLSNNNIEVLGRLVDTLEYEVTGVGYLLLGKKKNGSPYSEQDMKILEIIVNEMVIATENSLRLEEIEQFNLTLQNKIDEATKELKKSNDKLLALDQAKDEFVSMASHQLRTPLTSIKGYLSMVLEGDAGKISAAQKQMLGQAFFSSQRMVYLISDLLNVSRLKTGKFIIDAKPTNLADLVASEIDQLSDGAKSKDLTIAFTKPRKFPELMLDDMKLRQVVMNFVDNAIYYTPSGGKIQVKLKETATSVEFTVHDNGIGVPKDQQHKLFTKFYRADNARKSRPDGTGLGIFMAKKVIVAQGGSIIFDSKEGKGSTFGFSFPKEKLQVKESKAS